MAVVWKFRVSIVFSESGRPLYARDLLTRTDPPCKTRREVILEPQERLADAVALTRVEMSWRIIYYYSDTTFALDARYSHHCSAD